MHHANEDVRVAAMGMYQRKDTVFNAGTAD
jgi:hypothetical protein